MTPRGGYRGKHAVKKSRNLPTANITAYIPDKERLKQLSEQLKIPVVELLHRILKSPDFEKTIEAIKANIVDNWHEQEI